MRKDPVAILLLITRDVLQAFSSFVQGVSDKTQCILLDKQLRNDTTKVKLN